jgi:uncharacterized protein YjbI with pentapeptide repeats
MALRYAALRCATLRYAVQNDQNCFRYSTLLDGSLCYDTQRYVTLLRPALKLVKTILMFLKTVFGTLHCAALRCATLRYAALRCATLRYAALRCATLRYAAQLFKMLKTVFGTLRYSTLHFTSLRYSTLHYATLLRPALKLV